MKADASSILEFWFGRPGDEIWETMRRQWWDKDETFDQACRDAGESLWRRGMDGALDDWASDPHGALALVVLFDQLPRNMFRGTPAMYASDERANRVARLIDANDWKRHYTQVQQLFSDMPFEHAERVADQEVHVAFVRDRYTGPDRENCLRSAERHLEIVARFGRFPHRNAILGRQTTAEEAAFLKEPNSSF